MADDVPEVGHEGEDRCLYTPFPPIPNIWPTKPGGLIMQAQIQPFKEFYSASTFVYNGRLFRITVIASDTAKEPPVSVSKYE